jgi:hypothetical protein
MRAKLDFMLLEKQILHVEAGHIAWSLNKQKIKLRGLSP